MTYTVTAKNQAAIDTCWGGGSRFTFTLTSKYPNADRNDHRTTDITVEKKTFDAFEIGDGITLGFRLADEVEPVKSDV